MLRQPLLWIAALVCCALSLPSVTTTAAALAPGLRILRPRIMQDVVNGSVWMPYGPAVWSGRDHVGIVVWVPGDTLCSRVTDALELDDDAALPRPVAHTGPISYSDVGGTIALVNMSASCPMINQVYYAEVVLGATGIIACSSHENPTRTAFSMEMTAPLSHIPAVMVGRDKCTVLRDAVVQHHVLLEVALGHSTSEVYYS
ncbi:hypothetical protein NESM_000127300 [Novymonas esmeraldas]|uniref:Uncharacterized protein n=1 Tax=Novymonas esmeraldas TaxID=1808958 RepID=A0AAW0F3H3_9TRYP